MAGVFEDEAEQTVTIGEYIEGIEAEELEADLVLGGDEGKECTYLKGYMKRQAVFSCLTCVPAGNAGVCTACSLSCHDGHEVVELWTKRNFRCDCGNSKFGEFSCKLCPDKDPENDKNSYNHNFKGSYCTCGRPYPDPEAEEQIEMIQCYICEDWFHENHLGLDSPKQIPRDEEGESLYEEFICQKCALTCSFLKLYPASIWATSKQKNLVICSGKEELQDNVSKNGKIENAICNPENMLNSSSTCAQSGTLSSEEKSLDHVSIDGKIEDGISIPKNMLNCVSSCSNSEPSFGENAMQVMGKEKNLVLEKAKSDITSSPTCIFDVDVAAVSTVLNDVRPMFLSRKWRDLLCRCKRCLETYSQKGVHYLIDKEDSLEEYEKVAKEKREEKLQEQEGAELNFLNTLDHVQKIEILTGIADMKNEFVSFLESFDKSKPVTSADIQGVFENLAKKKKQRLS